MRNLLKAKLNNSFLFQYCIVFNMFLSLFPPVLNGTCMMMKTTTLGEITALMPYVGTWEGLCLFNCTVFTSSFRQTNPQLCECWKTGGGSTLILQPASLPKTCNIMVPQPSHRHLNTQAHTTPKHTSFSSAALWQTNPPPASWEQSLH